MPLPQNINVILGAGVFGIVCAATLYVVEQIRLDRRRHAMSKDLAQLHIEFAVLRKELDSLLNQQKQKYFYNVLGGRHIELWSICRVTKRQKRNKKDSFVASSTTSEDYSSALDVDSSDLEFYDISDEEGDKTDLDLERIDRILDAGSVEDLTICIDELKNLCISFPENPHLLWRLGKAHAQLFDKTKDQNHLTKGLEACSTALGLTPELSDTHKWFAILIGKRLDFQPIREKILDSRTFKEHLDAAVRLDPSDATLHHMLGRYAYDVAELKWYERKVMAALFAENPSGSYSEALEHFLEAERLSKNEWKLNSLYIAKCKIKLGEPDEAVKVLERAEAADTDNGVDGEFDVEIKELLKNIRDK